MLKNNFTSPAKFILRFGSPKLANNNAASQYKCATGNFGSSQKPIQCPSTSLLYTWNTICNTVWFIQLSSQNSSFFRRYAVSRNFVPIVPHSKHTLERILCISGCRWIPNNSNVRISFHVTLAKGKWLAFVVSKALLRGCRKQ